LYFHLLVADIQINEKSSQGEAYARPLLRSVFV
jgi:hypothetical protein